LKEVVKAQHSTLICVLLALAIPEAQSEIKKYDPVELK
jgi:hypothetical protein